MHRVLIFLAAGVAAAAAAAQPQTTIDPLVLIDVFGTPSTASPGLDQITVKPTDSPTVFVDPSGQSCKCLPYYLCNADLEAVDDENADITGFGVLDIRVQNRFGEERKCQESVERCCTKPKEINETVPTPPKQLPGCGYSNPKGLDFSLVGGTGAEALFGEYPWVVAVMDASTGAYAGVGVIIHPEVIMTGAHIAEKFVGAQAKIRAGEWDTQTDKERLPYQERNVVEIKMHENFNNKNLQNDMALLKLDSPLQLDQHINTLCLPLQGEDFSEYKNCVANGWGKDVFGQVGRYVVILKKVVVNMHSRETCTALLKRTRLGRRFKLHDSFVCAGGEEGLDTCQGDGGAPLACPVGDGRYKLTGLVAWGIGCGGKDVPAVYANVAYFRNWVDNKMNQWGYDVVAS